MWNLSELKDGFLKSPTGKRRKLVKSFGVQKSRTKNKNKSKKNVTEAPNNKSDEEPYKDFSWSITLPFVVFFPRRDNTQIYPNFL